MTVVGRGKKRNDDGDGGAISTGLRNRNRTCNEWRISSELHVIPETMYKITISAPHGLWRAGYFSDVCLLKRLLRLDLIVAQRLELALIVFISDLLVFLNDLLH